MTQISQLLMHKKEEKEKRRKKQNVLTVDVETSSGYKLVTTPNEKNIA
jgi:hypothetical protein